MLVIFLIIQFVSLCYFILLIIFVVFIYLLSLVLFLGTCFLGGVSVAEQRLKTASKLITVFLRLAAHEVLPS